MRVAWIILDLKFSPHHAGAVLRHGAGRFLTRGVRSADNHCTPPVSSLAGYETPGSPGVSWFPRNFRMARVRVYVDGFNVHYGALRGGPYKWLDFEALARILLDPADDMIRIRYFSARSKPTEGDPHVAQRQATYFRALESNPKVRVHLGSFLKRQVRRRPVDPIIAQQYKWIMVHDTEEKGSDVNLATYLLLDAMDALYDIALVISNDSDLVEPIRVVQDRFPVKVGVVYPVLNDKRKPSSRLRAVAAFGREINKRHQGWLRRAQLPDRIQTPSGVIRKPASW